MPTLRFDTQIDVDGATLESFPLVRRLTPNNVFANTVLIAVATSPGFFTPSITGISVVNVFAVTADQPINFTFAGGQLINVNALGYAVFADMVGLGQPQIQTLAANTTLKYLIAGN